jgi:hypothetical protein
MFRIDSDLRYRYKLIMVFLRLKKRPAGSVSMKSKEGKGDTRI